VPALSPQEAIWTEVWRYDCPHQGMDSILSASLGIRRSIVCFSVYPKTETRTVQACTHRHTASMYTQTHSKHVHTDTQQACTHRHTASMCTQTHKQWLRIQEQRNNTIFHTVDHVISFTFVVPFSQRDIFDGIIYDILHSSMHSQLRVSLLPIKKDNKTAESEANKSTKC